jgi:hypothetical protein
MSHGNEEAKHLRNCKTPESVQQECTVIVTGTDRLNVPSQKRKEAAEEPLYLKRV